MLVDLCSWHTILQGFDSLLKDKPLPPEVGDLKPMKTSHRQRSASGLEDNVEGLVNLPCETICDTPSRIGFFVDEATSSSLLTDANVPLNTQLRDILLAALAKAWRTVFDCPTMPTIWVEDEGRPMPLSMAVGCSTRLLPFHFPDDKHHSSLANLTCRVKDGLRRVAEDASSTMCLEDHALRKPVDILLRFWGDPYHLLEHSVFSRPPCHDCQDIEESGGQLASVEVVVELIEGKLHIFAKFCRSAHNEDEIERWAQTYQQMLTKDTLDLANSPPRLTLSDIYFHSMSYEELVVFEERLRSTRNIPCVLSIQSIYPCSEAHCGLISGLTGTASRHRFAIIFEITFSSAQSILAVKRLWLLGSSSFDDMIPCAPCSSPILPETETSSVSL
jgi:hypothetical protein